MVQPDTVTTAQNESTRSPEEVALQWATAVSEGDETALTALYETGATLHADGEAILGTANIEAFVLESKIGLEGGAVAQSGSHGLVTLRSGADADDRGEATRLRVRHGKIVEQWIGDVRSAVGDLASVPMTMSMSGRISADEHDLVWDMVDQLVSDHGERVNHVDVRLERHVEKFREDAVALRVTMQLAGELVRAHARAAAVRPAAAVVERRLKHRLRQHAERLRESHRQAAVRVDARPGESSTGSPRGERPVEEREVVRHKTVSPGPSTFEEAAFDLSSMDYDFFLYVDVETGDDALVARDGDDGSVIERHGPPTSTLAAARERLDVGREPFVFFRDEAAQRGHVLYRRHDGHYGLIVPVDG